MMKKAMFITPATFLWIIGFFCGFAAQSWADDDPNVFNQTMGISAIISGAPDAGGSCGWEEVFSRDGSDGGQLTIHLNTCKFFQYTIESFPQGGGAGGTADLEPDDIIIVWDEDAGHGANESEKNFTFSVPNGYEKIEEPEYEDYLDLSRADSLTNWAVYLVTAAGTFTKGDNGTNEHEVLHLSRNIMHFWKEDDVDETSCVSPGDTIEYSICWNNDSGQTIPEASIIDWLPAGEDHYVFDGNSIELVEGDPWYDPNAHSYLWVLGNIDPNESGCVQLEVTVNEGTVPGYYLYNLAELYSGEDVVAFADEYTNVCCWSDDPNIIYVDQSATDGADTGLDWANAYLDLADALERATNSLCGGPFTIYVAQGVYDPNRTPELTFALPEGCEVYGGFPTGGSDFSGRNPKRYKTTLTGLIDEETLATSVVTMGDETFLDGFTVTQSLENAIYGSGVDFEVSQCTITDNFGYGIYAENSNISVQWCTIRLNGVDGIQHKGEGYTLSVDNSWLLRNGEFGINCEESTPHLHNSIVSESDLTEQGRAGIRLYRPTHSPVLHNLTISRNRSAGILFEDNGNISGDPNFPDYPDLQNTIVYYNNPGGSQITGFSPDTHANFCCIQDCNEPGTTNFNAEPMFAYAVDPNGTPDPNNYHLAYNSRCIDEANPFLDYSNQVDIDGEGLDRKYGSYVDIGADEVYDCDDDYLSDIDVHNDLDWNADGIVNLVEFSRFSAAWLSRDPNDPTLPSDPNLIDPNDFNGWNPTCNLVTTGSSAYRIDLADVTEFVDNGFWLWVACWKLEEIESAAAQSQSQSMMIEPVSMLSLSSFSMEAETTALTVETIEPAPKATLDTLVQVVGFLDEVIADNPDNIENIEELRSILIDEVATIWQRKNE